jgi:DNA-binding transcriptional ArsR family regulator
MKQIDPHELRANLFKALGHPTRVKILEILRQGEICVCELVPKLGLGQSSVSQHLAVLRKQGLVTFDKDGLRVNYRLASPEIGLLLDASTELLRRQVQIQQELLTRLNNN